LCGTVGMPPCHGFGATSHTTCVPPRRSRADHDASRAESPAEEAEASAPIVESTGDRWHAVVVWMIGATPPHKGTHEEFKASVAEHSPPSQGHKEIHRAMGRGPASNGDTQVAEPTCVARPARRPATGLFHLAHDLCATPPGWPTSRLPVGTESAAGCIQAVRARRHKIQHIVPLNDRCLPADRQSSETGGVGGTFSRAIQSVYWHFLILVACLIYPEDGVTLSKLQPLLPFRQRGKRLCI
jgi:hypothetical protein